METLTVHLEDVVKAIEFAGSLYSYLNKTTGKVASFTEEMLSAAEDEDLVIEDYPEWEREPILEAKKMLASNDYLAIPGKYDLDEYRIMERFCFMLEDEDLGRELLSAIKGSGAFRRFKDCVHRHGIADQWYKYREDAIEKFAIEWLEEKGIKWQRKS